MKFLFYISRHITAIGLAAITAAVLWTIVYFALLLFAIFFGCGVGGPLSYPVLLISLLVGILGVGLFIFAPSCAFGRVIVGLCKWPQIAAIPFVFLAGGLLSYLVYAVFIHVATTHSMPAATQVFLNYLIYLSIPLGAYWWITDGPFAVIDGFRRWILRRLIPSSSSTADTSA